MEEIHERNRAQAVRRAWIDLGPEGKQLLKYQMDQEKSYQAAVRRVNVQQNGGRRGPGRPPKKDAAPVETPATGSPIPPETAAAVPTEGQPSDSEATVATTPATGAPAEVSTTIATPAGNSTTEAKTTPAAPLATPAGDLTTEAKTAPAATIATPAGNSTTEAKSSPAATFATPTGNLTTEAKTTPSATIATPAGNITTEAKTSADDTLDTELPAFNSSGHRLSTDCDESDPEPFEAEFLRQRRLYEMYSGRAGSGEPVAGLRDRAAGGEVDRVAPGDDAVRKGPEPPPLGSSGG